MSEFYSYQELPYGNKIEVVNLDDFMADFRVPGDVITVDETWLQNKLKENLKKDREIQVLKNEIKNKNDRIKMLGISIDVLRSRTRILNTSI